MKKEYRELFDEVHASQRLRTEVMNMKHEEIKPTHRIPRAALIAAVLLTVLAGTAVAAELLGYVQINLKNPDETNASGAGYTGKAAMQRIPAESLSEAALERAAAIEDGSDSWEFDSWSEAEAFLGVELLDNPKLEELPAFPRKGSCYAYVVNYAGGGRQYDIPFFIFLSASYQADGCRVTQGAHMQFQYPGYPQCEGGVSFGKYSGGTCLEEYTTPSGIKASIITTTKKQKGSNAIDHTSYTAYWATDHVLYSLRTSLYASADQPGAVHALDVLKEILDAYE